MSTYPPPPPGYVPPKIRPSSVTKYGVYTIAACIICLVVGVISIIFWAPGGYIMGPILIILGALFLIVSFAFMMGKSWALKWSGYANARWAQAPEVREFFNLPPVQLAYPGIPPVASPSTQPTCPTCGGPLRYTQQYQRWYCDKEQKYV